MTVNGFLRGALALAHFIGFSRASCVEVSNTSFGDDCLCHVSTSFTFDVSTVGADPCPSTGVALTIDFNALVVSTASPPDSDIADTTVTFNVDDLEANPTTFEVLLNTCDFPEGDAIVASVTYADDQGNSPDMSAVENNGVAPECGE